MHGGHYHIKTNDLLWFLYDKNFRHEKVNRNSSLKALPSSVFQTQGSTQRTSYSDNSFEADIVDVIKYQRPLHETAMSVNINQQYKY